MIIESVKEVMKELSLLMGIPFVRAEQSGKRSWGSFMSYKLLSQNENPYTEIISQEATEDSVLTETERDTEGVVSLTFFGNNIFQLWTIAGNAYTWFTSEAGKSVCLSKGIFPHRVTELQDRTSYVETHYEHRIGFDVICKGKSYSTSESEPADIAATIAEMLQNN